jgi:hypothetical protein
MTPAEPTKPNEPLLPTHAVPPSTLGTMKPDGTRIKMHPADVKGKWMTRRRVVFAALIVFYLVIPLIEIGGKPAIQLDAAARRFYLFGATFNAQDFWMVLLLVLGFAFGLLALTAWRGRVWCGWACPQTLYMEHVFRRIERLIEGDAAELTSRMHVGSVFFLYCPFSGERLERVLTDLEAIARTREIRVCCVDLPLPPLPWLELASPAAEALAVYRRHLSERGAVVFHISNRYLDLSGVVRQLADEAGMISVRVADEPPDDSPLLRSDWIVVTSDARLAETLRAAGGKAPEAPPAGRRPWTDDHHNLFEILK